MFLLMKNIKQFFYFLHFTMYLMLVIKKESLQEKLLTKLLKLQGLEFGLSIILNSKL